jgi:hypothetical protein
MCRTALPALPAHTASTAVDALDAITAAMPVTILGLSPAEARAALAYLVGRAVNRRGRSSAFGLGVVFIVAMCVVMRWDENH